MPIVLGCNADIYSAFTTAVPGAVGCRSYRDEVIHESGDVPTTFPGEPGSRVVASIRPHPDALLSGRLDDALLAMLRHGAASFAAPQLTVWHQAGNLYRDLSYITPAVVRLMHVKMQNLCKQVSGVQYGCIIRGDIPAMDRWIPYAPDTLDWYGIDVHWNDPFDFSTYDKLKAYLDAYRLLAQRRTGLSYPRINVCETSARDDSNRPQFFRNVAKWLHHHGGCRMLASYRGAGAGGSWAATETGAINEAITEAINEAINETINGAINDAINAFKYIVASYVHPTAGSGRGQAAFRDDNHRLS